MPIEVYPVPGQISSGALSDIQARLTTAEASISTLTNRNVLRNGDMGVAQRGDGAYVGNQYGVDGWRYYATGGSPVATRIATTPGTGLGINGAKYAHRTAVAGQSAAGDFVAIKNAIEGVRILAGQQVTLSFVAAATAGTPKIGVEVEQNFGTGGSPSASVNTAISAITINTTATRYYVTFTMPSIVGKTIGTNGDDYASVLLWLSAGTTSATRASSIGIQNSTIDITDVQLEYGTVPTLFERLPQQVQLAWCQRYYHRRTGSGTAGEPFASGVFNTTSNLLTHYQFPVPMRTTPSMAFATAGNFGVYGPGGYLCTSISVGVVGATGARIDIVHNSASTAGQGGLAYFGGTGGWVEASAEF